MTAHNKSNHDIDKTKNEALHTWKRDVLVKIVVNKKILIEFPGSRKSEEYLIPLISSHQGNIIYITNKDERTTKSLLNELIPMKISDVKTAAMDGKFIIQLNTSDSLPDETLTAVIDFINTNKTRDAIIIVNDAATIFGEKIQQLICNPPEQCILVLHNEKQLAEAYKNTDSLLERDILKNYWAIVSVDELLRKYAALPNRKEELQ